MSNNDHGVRPSEDEGAASQKVAGSRFPVSGRPPEASRPADVFRKPAGRRRRRFRCCRASRSRAPKRAFQHSRRTDENAGRPSFGPHAHQPRYVYVSRPSGSYARPIIIWRLPSSTSLASSGRRSIFSFARLPRRAATTSPSFFPAPALMARWASRPSRRRAASSWSRTLTRPNTDPCPAAPSRQVARILFCRCANSRPASRTDPRSEESAVRRSRRNGRGGDAAHSLPFARSIRARLLELQKVDDWPSHRAQNAGAARPDNGGLSRNPA